MPKRIEEPDEELDDDAEDEELEEEERDKRLPKFMKPVKKLPPLPPLPKSQKALKRYVPFQQQALEGIMDNETKEVLATDIWTALSDILERLERIENTIGSMVER